MILKSELEKIGRLLKTHGIKGELNCLFDENVDPYELKYLIIEIDGIYVPFFIESLRQKNGNSYLVKFEGIDDVNEAIKFTSKDLNILKTLYEAKFSETKDEDVIYLEDLKGFTIYDNDNKIGTVRDIEDSTENVLFIVEGENDKTIYIPAADELISEVDTENRLIKMDLPIGIIDI